MENSPQNEADPTVTLPRPRNAKKITLLRDIPTTLKNDLKNCAKKGLRHHVRSFFTNVSIATTATSGTLFADITVIV